ncbi:MAG TPA: hypothetical protein VN947_05165 [Polyangia bacterium]|nr:hypothetical protein [Polyangia bacterium]
MRAFAFALLLLIAFAAPGIAKPKQGEPCDSHGKCAHGLTCVRYYGVAGARGPQMSSCEIKCDDGKARCPKGQACKTIADGPGQVCRVAGNP